MVVLSLGAPGILLSVLTTSWQWGFQYTIFTLCFVYTVIYFMYWFFTDFWDNA